MRRDRQVKVGDVISIPGSRNFWVVEKTETLQGQHGIGFAHQASARRLTAKGDYSRRQRLKVFVQNDNGYDNNIQGVTVHGHRVPNFAKA